MVDRAVKWLLEVGCSVIVLSATLAAARRKSLVLAAGADEPEISDAYPLITKVAKGSSHSPAPFRQISPPAWGWPEESVAPEESV